MFTKQNYFRFGGTLLSIAALSGLFFLGGSKSAAAEPEVDPVEQLKVLKARIRNAPKRIEKTDSPTSKMKACDPLTQTFNELGVGAVLIPTANLCINGSLAVTDPNYQRVAAVTTGSGISGSPGCNLSAQTPRYDVYSFNLSSCAVFPTVVTVTTCGPAGCTPTANTDAVTFIYRNVSAGDPLTANGGLPAVFNPASACTNVRAANDDLTGAAVAAGGSSCNQLNTTDCLAACTGTTLTSGMKRSLGSGRFTVVVTGSGTSTNGTYNLYVDAPAAGCAIALAPTAASGTISGRVLSADGGGLSRVLVTVSGDNLPAPLTVQTNSFGSYMLSDLPNGIYVVAVQSKKYSFSESSRVVDLQDNIADLDFVSDK